MDLRLVGGTQSCGAPVYPGISGGARSFLVVHMSFLMTSDALLPLFKLKAVLILKRAHVFSKCVPHEVLGRIWFMDGLSTENGTSVRLYDSRDKFKTALSLVAYTMVFQALQTSSSYLNDN